MQVLNVIVGGILLPFRIYVQPVSFADEIAGLAPSLPRNYSLWQARSLLYNHEFRVRIVVLLVQITIALSISVLFALLLRLMGFELDWRLTSLGVTFGLFVSAVFLVFSNVALGIALCVTAGIAFSLVGWVVENAREYVSSHFISPIADLTPTVPFLGDIGMVTTLIVSVVVVLIMFGIVVGVSVGALAGIVHTVAYEYLGVSTKPGRVENSHFAAKLRNRYFAKFSDSITEFLHRRYSKDQRNLFSMLQLLTELYTRTGLIIGFVGVITFGLTGGYEIGLSEVTTMILGGLAGGAFFSVSFCVLAVSCHMFIFSRLFLFPFQVAISIGSWLAVQVSPQIAAQMWFFCPARWDETVRFPLPGLASFLFIFAREDQQLGYNALNRVRAHRFQGRVAQEVRARLTITEANNVSSLNELVHYRHVLDWVDEESDLRTETRNLLIALRDISHEASSALEADSIVNRVRILSTVLAQIESLKVKPGPYATALSRWTETIQSELLDARGLQRFEAPIPQVYIRDGRPIVPVDRKDAVIPFKGRKSLFKQLEAAVGVSTHSRETLLLVGQRRIGKSSALLQLPRRLGGQIVPAFLDLQDGRLGGADNDTGLLTGIANCIRDEAGRSRKLAIPEVNHVMFLEDPYPAFSRWLDDVEQSLGTRSLLLCLDEFEVIEEGVRDKRFDERILNTIRNIIQFRRNISILLSGSHQIDELHPRWADKLVTTASLPISFLEEADARELIECPVEGFPKIYHHEAVNLIIKLTHCHPYLVQLVCNLLVERMNSTRRYRAEEFVTVDDVQNIELKVIETGVNYFHDLWVNQTGGSQAQRILEHLAYAPNGKLSRAYLRQVARNESLLEEGIMTLHRREIIEQVDDGYRIIIPLVAAYVRRQHQRR